MKFLTSETVICLLLISCSPLLSLKSQTSVKKSSSGSVSGTVTLKGKPVAGITVVASNGMGGPQVNTYQAKTDQDGHYRIRDVPPGSCQVKPEAPAFVVSDNSRGTTLIIDEGESVENINFDLAKGGVITGRVTNSEGQPLIEQPVSVMLGEINPNNSGDFNIGMTTGGRTDDRGVYRIFGLRQGKYKVYVGRSESRFPGGPRTRAVQQTFYPDVREVSKAGIVEVSEGSETKNIDITADTNDTSQKFSASGRIIDGVSGQPVSNLRVGIQSFSGGSGGRSFGVSSFSTSTASVTDSEGQFKVEGLVNGKYAIFIDSMPDSDLRADNVPFEISDGDVTGLVIKSFKGASVSGQIVVEGDDKSLRSRLAGLIVQVSVQNSIGGHGKSALTLQDGNFYIGGLPEGTAVVSVQLRQSGPVKPLMISRIERDGVIQPHGLEIKDGEQVTGVKVFVNSSNGTIRGVVKFENGEMPGNHVSVWVTRSDQTRDSTISSSVQVDARGHFVVEGLPAGTYEVNASVYVPGQQRRTQPSGKQQVTVADGVVSEVTITIDLSPGP
ncbi:MAG: hypothetical protein C5B55_06025 [Blastocatellia bacterium]|nr:MAG: hypothetical protein C5B55_06025 [Blastocatellia bacterium]